MKPSKQNNAIVKALKTIKETDWVGNVKHDTLDKCVRVISQWETCNSGLYNPPCIKINGIKGTFIVNEGGQIHFLNRIIKQDDKFLVEYLRDSAYNRFEEEYRKQLQKQLHKP